MTTYDVSSYTNSKEADGNETHRYGVMRIKENDFQVHPHIFPDAKEMNLAYKEESKYIYTLNLCEQRGSNITKFIYSWNDGEKIYVAAPYYATTSSEIMCSHHLNITEAVVSENPEAISKILKQLTNSSNSKSGFDNDLYRWRKYGHDDNNFTVSNKKAWWNIFDPHTYWKEGKLDDDIGKMIQIGGKNKESQKVRLRFIV